MAQGRRLEVVLVWDFSASSVSAQMGSFYIPPSHPGSSSAPWMQTILPHPPRTAPKSRCTDEGPEPRAPSCSSLKGPPGTASPQARVRGHVGQRGLSFLPCGPRACGLISGQAVLREWSRVPPAGLAATSLEQWVWGLRTQPVLCDPSSWGLQEELGCAGSTHLSSVFWKFLPPHPPGAEFTVGAFQVAINHRGLKGPKKWSLS